MIFCIPTTPYIRQVHWEGWLNGSDEAISEYGWEAKKGWTAHLLMPKLPGYMQIIVHDDIYISIDVLSILHTHDCRVYFEFILLLCLACRVQICNQFKRSYPLSIWLLLLATLDTLLIGKYSCCVVVCFNIHILRSCVSCCSFLSSLLLRQMETDGST